MSMFKAGLAVRVLLIAAVSSLGNLSLAPAATPPTKANPATAAQPALNHSAPYTRLLGTAWPAGPVKFADHQRSQPQRSQPQGRQQPGSEQSGIKVPAQAMGWHHYGRPYYVGYGGAYGPYGFGGYGVGYGYGVPYNVGYAGYPAWGWNMYQPYTYSYRPWIGGWGGYPYYSSFTPGFGGYYGVGSGGPAGPYGGYGGCCYW